MSSRGLRGRSCSLTVHVIVAAFLALVFLSGLPSLASARDKYGAIAYCASQDVCAVAHDYDTKDGAERRALERCKQKKGTDCQIVASFKNACAALAVAEDGSYGWAWRTRKAEAEQQALKKCEEKGSGCRVYCWTCTGPSPSEGRPPDTVVVPPPAGPPGVVGPPHRGCNCCRRIRTGGCYRDPRTRRIICVDGFRDRCNWMSREHCRSIGGVCR